MRNENTVPEEWEVWGPPKFAGDSTIWLRKEPSKIVCAYFLINRLPLWGDGTPSKRLMENWRDFEGVTWWWRIDGPEEEWKPAGYTARRSAEHAGGHIATMQLMFADRDIDSIGPCPECARLLTRATQERSER